MRSSNASEALARPRLVTQSRPMSQGRSLAVCIVMIPSRSLGPFFPAWRGRIRSRGRLVRWWRLVANSTSLAATPTPVCRPLRPVAMTAQLMRARRRERRDVHGRPVALYSLGQYVDRLVGHIAPTRPRRPGLSWPRVCRADSLSLRGLQRAR